MHLHGLGLNEYQGTWLVPTMKSGSLVFISSFSFTLHCMLPYEIITKRIVESFPSVEELRMNEFGSESYESQLAG